MTDADRWERISQSPQYRAMIALKTRFVVVATVFFIAYYFALPVLVGYFPELMKRRVWGDVNLAYLFAFSQFFMAWILAYLYMRIAGKFDMMTEQILADTDHAAEVE